MKHGRRLFTFTLGLLAAIPLLGLQMQARAQQTPEAHTGKFSTPAQQQKALVNMAQQSVEVLRKHNATAENLWPETYGYAVFDATKGGLIVTGVGGTGAAMPKHGNADDATFMHVGGAGIGLSAGLSNYKLILFFKDKSTFDQFVRGDWSAGVGAQAVAGQTGNAGRTTFQHGVKAFRLTDAGLIASADVSAMRFWPTDLNHEGPRAKSG